MPDRTDWKVSPIVKVKDNAWEALDALTLNSVKIGGVDVVFDGTPLLLKPGQRLVIEWQGGSEATVEFHTAD